MDILVAIAACIVGIFTGHAWICGVTLPFAGASAKDFWDNTFGGYDYAEDMCSGLPDQSPVYVTTDEPDPDKDEAEKKKEEWVKQCKNENGVVHVEKIKRANLCMSDAENACWRYSTFYDAAKRLVGAVCIEGKDNDTDTVICVWCAPGNV